MNTSAFDRSTQWAKSLLRKVNWRFWKAVRETSLQPPTISADPEPELESLDVSTQTNDVAEAPRDVFAAAKSVISVLNAKTFGGDIVVERALRMIGPVVTDGFYESIDGMDLSELPSICSVAFIDPEIQQGFDADKVYPLWGGLLEVPVGIFGDDVRYDEAPAREFQSNIVFWDREKKKQLAVCIAVGVDRSGTLHFSKVREKVRTKIAKWNGTSNQKQTRVVKTGKFVPSLRGEYASLEKLFEYLVATCFRVKELCDSDRNCEVSMSEGPVTIRFLDDRDRMKDYYPPKTRNSLSGKQKILHWVESFQAGNRFVRGHYRGDDKFIHDGLEVRIRPMHWGYNPLGFVKIRPCKAQEVAGDFGRRKRLMSTIAVAKKIRKTEMESVRLNLRDLDKRQQAA